MIEIALTGQWKTARAAVPHIIRGGRGGSVVFTSSLAAMCANPNLAHYAAAKAGVVMLMKVLAKEVAAHNIRVNAILPSTVATDMVLNEPTYRLFRPDAEHPGWADFEVATRMLNKLPTPLFEAEDISNKPSSIWSPTPAGTSRERRTPWTPAASSASTWPSPAAPEHPATEGAPPSRGGSRTPSSPQQKGQSIR
ncbi:SDR family NAD(P)-dependent oxidoreductase [Streptomyces canus]|uniref:SDR family NAD(P)-dependent oxidoreductase n=1 Tax=Streptomyces TaxID=1883 RepID=UPI000AD5B618|nr:SDR family NAD(P)-dependent oxidoreductase [Streptomyces sp. LUP47B]